MNDIYDLTRKKKIWTLDFETTATSSERHHRKHLITSQIDEKQDRRVRETPHKDLTRNDGRLREKDKRKMRSCCNIRMTATQDKIHRSSSDDTRM